MDILHCIYGLLTLSDLEGYCIRLVQSSVDREARAIL